MKKSMVIIFLVVLVGGLLTAANPMTSKNQSLQGRLLWERASVCGASDFVSNQAMDKIYLTGNFFPTHGELQGCQVTAVGYYYDAGACKYFSVNKYGLACLDDLLEVTDH